MHKHTGDFLFHELFKKYCTEATTQSVSAPSPVEIEMEMHRVDPWINMEKFWSKECSSS
jgi:hypothetical protein